MQEERAALSHLEGEEREKELKDKCLSVLYNRSGRELSR